MASATSVTWSSSKQRNVASSMPSVRRMTLATASMGSSSGSAACLWTRRPFKLCVVTTGIALWSAW
eukprot:CAMPEP_0117689092 /NCGR_PEP_ID=MMETSP0804-20121206/24262_1 /TAXON_ID=1074897 /ORGANISM="Tetraselmis astigmatica, Strain CCMP880" /LENGTH=65 /DNA_ID=CAMNT_0005501755 /DNA_START=886 /DNA_END=1080 /DNA_ORIENTATION=+